MWELKEHFLKRMNTERVGQWTNGDDDDVTRAESAKHLRLINMKTGEVMLDDLPIGEAVGGLLTGGEMLSVVVLDRPEQKLTNDQMVINVFQHFPSTFQTDEPGAAPAFTFSSSSSSSSAAVPIAVCSIS